LLSEWTLSIRMYQSCRLGRWVVPRNQAPSDELLRTAAEMRAGGASWPAVGKAVGRSAATVGRWPCFYAARAGEYLAEASTDLLNEAAAEALLVLRRQLRSKSELVSKDAAGKIVRFVSVN